MVYLIVSDHLYDESSRVYHSCCKLLTAQVTGVPAQGYFQFLSLNRIVDPVDAFIHLFHNYYVYLLNR